MQNGKLGTGWVDKSYRKYEFKEFCPYHIGISIDLTDKVAENNSTWIWAQLRISFQMS